MRPPQNPSLPEPTAAQKVDAGKAAGIGGNEVMASPQGSSPSDAAETGATSNARAPLPTSVLTAAQPALRHALASRQRPTQGYLLPTRSPDPENVTASTTVRAVAPTRGSL